MYFFFDLYCVSQSPHKKNCYIIESRQKELLHNEKNAQPETAPEVHNDIPKSPVCKELLHN